MALIGVVVPVYKVEPFLRRCVDSILCQTFSDFDLILVDDGSPDNCGEICEEYARLDSRVRVIHQKNAGLSAARNAGIDLLQAEGCVQWLTFIDSDDWVHPRMLEILLASVRTHGVKIASCGFKKTIGNDPEVSTESCAAQCLDAKDFYLHHFINATIACAKLYHRSCFETVRYPLGKLHEDEFITYRLLFAEQRVAATFVPLYAYYINMESITQKSWVSKRLDAWEAYEQQIAFFEERGDAELVRFRYRGYLENAVVNLQNAQKANTDGQYDREIRYIRRRIRSVIRRAWKKGEISFRYEVDMLLTYYPLITRIYRLYKEWKEK